MSPIDKLTELFERFPGIGPRQARRFVQYLLSAPPGMRAELSRQVQALGASTAQCKRCYKWFTKGRDATDRCPTCSDPSRDAGMLFVVEKDADLDNVERSGYRGLYFVLGGTVPLGAEDPGSYIRLRELAKRAETDADSLTEIIVGVSATSEGDHTRQLLAETLRPIGEAHDFKITSLGRGLSTGSELEYADPDTIAAALSSRQ